MQSAKETASNVAASAKSGLEKAKATAQEKVEKMTTRDPVEKEMAKERKEERMTQAELDKEAARAHNAAARHTGTQDYTAATGTGAPPDYLTGDPRYGGEQPHRRQTEGVVGSQNPPGEYPAGTGRVPLRRNTQTGVGHPDQREGTGGAYGGGGDY